MERMVWKPRFDEKKLWACVDNIILKHFMNNPNEYFTLEELREMLLDKELLLHTFEIMMRLAVQDGIKGKIKSSIHKWREHGYPILSSDKIGRGYVYVDPNHPETPKFWDRKLRANEKIREMIPITERRTDEKLFEKCIQGCKEADIYSKMVKIAVKHGIKRKKKA